MRWLQKARREHRMGWPGVQTCANAASVCKRFETSRRREVLSLRHHKEVASFDLERANSLLELVRGFPPKTSHPQAALMQKARRVKMLHWRPSAPSIFRDVPLGGRWLDCRACKWTLPIHRKPQIRLGNLYNMLSTFGNNGSGNTTAKKTKTFARTGRL